MERTRDRGREDDRDSRRSSSRDDDRSSRSRDRDDDRSSRSRDDDRGGRDREERSSRSSRDDDRGSDRGRSSGSGTRYEYAARSAAQVGKRASMGANDFDKILKDNVKMWKPNDGDNRIRILPPTWPKPEHYGLDIYVNYGVGPDRGSYLALDKHKGEADPIAEERERARNDGDEKYAKELSPKRRVLVYLIDRDHEKEGVQAWAMPWTVDRDIVKVSQDKRSGEVLPIDDPENGYDIEFEKRGAKDRTEYLAVSVARRSSELGNPAWMDFAVDNPLPDQLNFFDYETIAKAFKGQGAQKERRRDDDRDDDRGRRDDDRGRDRDDDRGSRGRDDDRRSGGRDDDRSRDRDSGRGRSEDPVAQTWETIHDMTKTELEDLIDQEELDINPKDAKDTEDLADWICEEMKLKKEETTTRRRVTDDPPADTDRLRDMRRRRED